MNIFVKEIYRLMLCNNGKAIQSIGNNVFYIQANNMWGNKKIVKFVFGDQFTEKTILCNGKNK